MVSISYGFTTSRNNLVRSASFCERRLADFSSYTLSVSFGYMIVSSKAGKKNSALGFPALACLARPLSWNVTPSRVIHLNLKSSFA